MGKGRSARSISLTLIDVSAREKRSFYRAHFEFKKLTRSPPREEKHTLVGFWNPPRHEDLMLALQNAGIVPDAPHLPRFYPPSFRGKPFHINARKFSHPTPPHLSDNTSILAWRFSSAAAGQSRIEGAKRA
jgi:hypothetical protein